MNTVNGVPCLFRVEDSAGAFTWSKTFSQNAWSSYINIAVSQGATPYLVMTSGFKYSKMLIPMPGVVTVVATPSYFEISLK
ncbi:MAG: hypothetical protein IPN13_15220 [Bacteroidetes bacterium]|nr:hypothetical protein [Bacteroidota bacterium]